jgi:hypothetical protein
MAATNRPWQVPRSGASARELFPGWDGFAEAGLGWRGRESPVARLLLHTQFWSMRSETCLEPLYERLQRAGLRADGGGTEVTPRRPRAEDVSCADILGSA